MRPPPGGMPPQSDLMSPPHADLITNNSSRGRIGRSTMAVGVVAGAAVVAAAAGAAVVPFAAGVTAAFGAAVAGLAAGGVDSALGVVAGAGSAAFGAAAGASTARTAPAHADERLDMFF